MQKHTHTNSRCNKINQPHTFRVSSTCFISQAYKELLLSVVALQRVGHEDAQALYRMLENNVCYVMEFRETMLHTLMNYQEAVSTK